ncbi:hypothetical protein [Aquibium oceanicum]|uniref:hypothetical protein n=1 Tax=Aquibium oceanicum TaxID=1670800 RepID=UPI000933A445|nr:hypothetical protein [Aquibium oceanicum]
MSGGEKLSLDEFATAPRRQRVAAGLNLVRPQSVGRGGEETVPDATVVDDQGSAETASEAGKALRRMKRARMKGAAHFVNVNLDRETKRRLKLASFNSETSMQVIMEKAIREFLDANGY